MQGNLTLLPHRQIICLKGEDKIPFLQGLVTNDVRKIYSEKLLYSALLTPQGKFLYDLFIIEDEKGDWLIDCENPSDLIKRLNLYKLRSSIELINLEDQFKVYALWGEDSSSSFQKEEGDIIVADPRLPELGYRMYCRLARSSLTSLELYDHYRISLGIPDGSHDITIQKGIILEYNFDELGAIDWGKGCYIGQELMARTHHRGMLHKRLLPIEIEGEVPPFGTPILDVTTQAEVGELKSSIDGMGLAMLRLSIFENSEPLSLKCCQAKVTPLIPYWLSLNSSTVSV